MKCFIASAFGRDDVDAIYDHCVLPILKKLSIKPLRVDRVEHNDDIDNKIIELLEGAEFALVDLTYARPSVYYETGYAAGSGKPVIYIARGDHFRARDDDPEGLLRVHFDLQMKNIVRWSTPNDAFSKRLEKRFKYILKPLLKQRDVDEKLKFERAEFRRLPENSKVKLLKAKTGALLKARSFSLPKPEPGGGVQSSGLLAVKEAKQRSQQVIVICTPSAVKRIFDEIEMIRSWGIKGSNRELPMQLHDIIVSLRSVPRSRVTQALSSFHLLDDGALHRRYESTSRPALDVFVHVISGIQSQPEFTDVLRSVFARYEFEKSA